MICSSLHFCTFGDGGDEEGEIAGEEPAGEEPFSWGSSSGPSSFVLMAQGEQRPRLPREPRKARRAGKPLHRVYKALFDTTTV